ncbi:glycosyltransferase [Ferruginibacter sp.]|uniref:glycosyltransferase n=1 Tax=Ferruginibacter sp. TaxID=1940288 RepID=UPI00374DC101
MNIVININSLPKMGQYDDRFFLKDRIQQLIISHPQHNFFIISADKNEPLASLKNSSIVKSNYYGDNVRMALWYACRLPRILKNTEAAIFINMAAICSLKTTVPQCLILQESPTVASSTVFLKKTEVYLKKAITIIASSEFLKNDICKNFKITEDKVQVIYNGTINNFLPIAQPEKEGTKEKYADGKEYFLFAGELNKDNNLLNLLKAFSFFKKRQKSNMQLLIVANNYLPGSLFEKSLQSYKYRNEVKLLPNLPEDELVKIIAAAYVSVYATFKTASYCSVVQAMQCGVPVIVSNTLLMNEICKDVALFTDPAVFKNIADKMMLAFKDETLRNDLVAKGKLRAASFNVSAANDLLWQCIEKNAAKND